MRGVIWRGAGVVGSATGEISAPGGAEGFRGGWVKMKVMCRADVGALAWRARMRRAVFLRV